MASGNRLLAQNLPRPLPELIERLTRPSPHLQPPDQRQQARILTSLIVAFLAIVSFTGPFWLVITENEAITGYIFLGSFLALLLAYGLSRTPVYMAGATLLVLTMFGLVLTIMIAVPTPVTERMMTLPFLVVAVIISGQFLRWQYTVLVFLFSLTIISTFFFVPGVPLSFTYAHLLFFLLITGLNTVGVTVSYVYRQRLSESETLYRSLIAALSEGIVLQMQDGSIRACNATAEKILGVTAEQLLGYTAINYPWSTIHEDGSPFPVETHPAMITLRTGQPLTQVVMGVYHPDGQLRWIEINSQPLTCPHTPLPYAVVTSFLDITTRKQNERALLEAEHRYHALFEQGHDAVFILDLQGQHVESNQRAAELMGYTTAELQQMTFRDLSAEADKSEKIRDRLLNGEDIPVYERFFRHKDGRFIPVEINAELVRDPDGRPRHIQSVVRDISERKQAQQQEMELTLEKERLSLLTTFMQNAAHEFRTPLAIIDTTAYVMAHLAEPHQRGARAEVIQAQVQRLAKLIEMLLVITQIESDVLFPQAPVDISRILAPICQQFMTQYKAHKPLVIMDSVAKLPPVLGDEEELRQAFAQILDNAYRFTPANGEITLSAGQADDHLWLAIQDTGVGIAAEDMPHIFQTFWRQDKAHTTPGFGLGLPIAQKIISRHSGQLTVSSQLGAGTTVHIRLPICPRA